MAHELILRDHQALQRAIARTTLAGLGAGLLHAIWPGPAGDGLGLLAVGLAAVVPRTLTSAMIAASLASLAGAAGHLLGVAGVGAAGILGGLLFARDLEGALQKGVATVAGLLALGAGWFVISALHGSEPLGGLAPRLEWLALGGAGGFLAGFGVLGRELELAPALPAVDGESVRSLPDRTVQAGGPGERSDGGERAIEGDAGELGELLGRARVACREVQEALGDEVPGASAAARDLVDKIARFASRWREIERQLATTDRAALATRRERMAERAKGVVDEAARADYLRAERALAQQVEDLEHIHGLSERAVARLHHHVAVLERLRLAGLHRRSADAGFSGEELAPLVEELGVASLDLDGEAEAMASLPPG